MIRAVVFDLDNTLVDFMRMKRNSVEAGVHAMIDAGLRSSKEDIDEGMVAGCGMPMGPLRLCDMIGLDTMLLVSESLYAEHLELRFAPPALLKRHVEAGMFGRKSGRGFLRPWAARRDTGCRGRGQDC